MAQSDSDAVVGILRIRVGTDAKEVPTLKAKYIDAWVHLVTGAEGSSKPLAEWTTDDAATFAAHQIERMLDLIVAYDREEALGGRDWLAENADPQQLRVALEQMVENASPFGDAPTITALSVSQGALLSILPGSSSGASMSGGATRRKSARASTRRR